MRPIIAAHLLTAGLLLAPGCAPASQPDAADAADMIVTGGRVWTGNLEQPWAGAVAITGNRIVAVGANDEIERSAGPSTVRIDATGGLVIPGFIDTHTHFIYAAFGLSSVQLRDAATPQEFASRIATYAATLPPGSWIQGGQWDHENWGGELPHRDWIDALTADHPVAITRLDGHMLLANSAALEAAGINEDTASIAGGTIVRDANGRPTGILKDNAMNPVLEAIPAPPAELQDRALQNGIAHLLAQGVTTVHNMGDPALDSEGIRLAWRNLDVFERAHARAALGVRVYACMPLEDWDRLRDRIAAEGQGDAWLRLGCLKGMVDGSLGSHTAAFHEPFTDAPDDTGLLIHEDDPDAIYRWALAADAAGLQVNVHAIGDRAIDSHLDAIERIASENGPRDRRFRIEHAQHPTAGAIARFAELGVIASMQPYHAIDDGRWAERVIGPLRARTTYAFRSFLDAGVVLAFGSDWDVAPPTPLEGIYAAVTRRTLDGANPDGWIPEQRITVEEALWAYTVAGAYASFEEDDKGSIEPGKLADIVVLDRDLTAIPAAEIREARVSVTIVDGRIAYERER